MGSGCEAGEADEDWTAVPSWEGDGSVRRSVVGLLRESELGLGPLLDEWERSGGRVEAALARAEHSGKGAVLVMDAFTHELDIRLALGVPFPVGHPAFRADAWRWVVGTGEPTAVVRGSRTDLYRALAGRRTYRQIEQLTWSIHPGPWLPAFGWGPFRPPDQPVE